MSPMPSPTRCRQAALAVLAAAALTAALAACGDDGGSSSKKSSNSSSSATGSSSNGAHLTVLAASSLTDVFKQEATGYQKAHPGSKVAFSFAGSQELAAQVKQGAPADALVTADTKTMNGVRPDIAGKPLVIARNRLVIVVRKGNPKKVKALKDLTEKNLKVVLAAPEVPVGNYSKQVLDKQHLAVKPVSQEANVRVVLSKVELGEADAGIVYVTDAATAPGKVDTVAIPDAQNAIASYPAAALKDSKHAAAAGDFVRYLGSPEGQKIMQGAGFQKP